MWHPTPSHCVRPPSLSLPLFSLHICACSPATVRIDAMLAAGTSTKRTALWSSHSSSLFSTVAGLSKGKRRIKASESAERGRDCPCLSRLSVPPRRLFCAALKKRRRKRSEREDEEKHLAEQSSRKQIILFAISAPADRPPHAISHRPIICSFLPVQALWENGNLRARQGSSNEPRR